jgi:hypothetical protein
MQANSNPGQFLTSYWNGFAGSLPKLASKEDTSGVIVTAGKRRSTVGLIGIFRPENLGLLGQLWFMLKLINWKYA